MEAEKMGLKRKETALGESSQEFCQNSADVPLNSCVGAFLEKRMEISPVVGTEKEFDCAVEDICRKISALAFKHFNISLDQLKKFSDKEIIGMLEMLSIILKPWVRSSKMKHWIPFCGINGILFLAILSGVYFNIESLFVSGFIFLIPGLLFGGLALSSFYNKDEVVFLSACEVLKQRYGNNWHPCKEIKKHIQTAQE